MKKRGCTNIPGAGRHGHRSANSLHFVEPHQILFLKRGYSEASPIPIHEMPHALCITPMAMVPVVAWNLDLGHRRCAVNIFMVLHARAECLHCARS